MGGAVAGAVAGAMELNDHSGTEPEFKILMAGDGAIGKTCLLSRFTDKTIDWEDGDPVYEPTTFQNFIVEWEHPTDGPIVVEVWDTAGQEDFASLRKVAYPDTHIFLVGYSCVSEQSLSNVQFKWVPEIQESVE